MCVIIDSLLFHTFTRTPQAVIDGLGGAGESATTTIRTGEDSGGPSSLLLAPQDRVLYVERLAEYDPGAVSAYLRCVVFLCLPSYLMNNAVPLLSVCF